MKVTALQETKWFGSEVYQWQGMLCKHLEERSLHKEIQ